MKNICFMVLAILFLFGCAEKLPEEVKVSTKYSIENVESFSVAIDCEKTKVTNLPPTFIENYCQLLETNLKLALQSVKSTWRYVDTNPELKIETILEQVHGGSADTRFWIGFGAGRSVTTIYVKIFQNDVIVAERRFNETTTMPNLVSDTWSNEDVVIQDARLIAEKIASFVKNPSAYDK